MGLSDYMVCSCCGSSIDEGCADSCSKLQDRAERCRQSGFDPAELPNNLSLFFRVLDCEDQIEMQNEYQRRRRGRKTCI
jgi:predicted amidophosphoribosyltransferase